MRATDATHQGFLRLAIGGLLSAAIMLGPATAMADAAAGPQAGAAKGDSLEEIIVTAQRREQRLQDVGISVTALSGDTLASLGVVNASDLTQFVPSLKLMSFTSSAVVFNIRGVSQNDWGNQQEPPVAAYYDDSYASTLALTSFPIFDLARAEVLRGPQGTLFGRNATGGAIQFISNQPSDDTKGYAQVSYGSFDAVHAEAAVGGALAPGWSFRLAGQVSEGGNYMKAIEPGMHDLGGNHNQAMRTILQWKPADDFTAKLTLRYLNGSHEYSAGAISFEPACPNAQFQGYYLAADQGCDYWGSPPGGIIGDLQHPEGYRNPGIVLYQGGDPWHTASTKNPPYTSRYVFGGQLHIDAHLGNVDLTSITDYQHANKYYQEDVDGSPMDLATYYDGLKLEQVSEELRLSGKAGRNEWVVGGLAMSMDGKYIGGFQMPVYDYFPAAVFSQKTTSTAIFGQDEFQFDPQWKLIGGLRLWQDKRTAYYHAADSGFSGIDITYGTAGISYLQDGVPQSGYGLTVTPADASHSFSGVTARLELDYKPSDSLLLYGSYNRGGKSGGYTFSTATPFFPSGVAPYFNQLRYKPETLTSLELGMKATLSSTTTFNVDVFHYDYKDYQAFAQYGLEQTIVNLQASELGLEAELNSRPVRGLTLNLNASMLSSRIKNVPLPDGVTFSDHNLPESPHISMGAFARYEVPMGNGSSHFQVDTNYVGRYCFTALCAPVENERSRVLVNLRAGYDVNQWSFDLYGNNVTNRAYRAYATDNSLTAGFVYSDYAAPRVIGVEVQYKFGGTK